MFKFLLLLPLFCVTSNSASSIDQIKRKADFLNSVKREVQEKDKNNDKFKDQTAECLECIEFAQCGLELINTELKKTKRNKEILNELIEDFNKKIKNLKDKYKFLMLSEQESNDSEAGFSQDSMSVSAIDSLNPTSRKKPLKKGQDFEDIEFIKIPSEELPRTTRQESHIENKIFPIE
ncbi:MAG: hypothetical protein LBU35_02550 [Holosporales bacterium]|jgi:septal ring factor EnvC (AmiA/AmiB activator)|nr:hypothetical protein [Holosporales bacterium]